jgi:leucyl aminopeptidase
MSTLNTNTNNKVNQNLVAVYLVHSLENIGKAELLKTLQFEGKYGQITILAESKEVYVGTKYENVSDSIDPFAVADYYELGVKITKALKTTNFEGATIYSPAVITTKQLEHLLLGALQGGVDFDKYLAKKTSKDFDFYLEERLLEVLDQSRIDYLNAINHAVTLTRKVVEDTPQAINPATMPEIIKAEFENNANVSIKILDYATMLEMGMEGITAVGRASINKPVLVHTTIKPKGETKKKIVLIGKGLCYDSGGYDIKTGGNMKGMKDDMAGSGTMFGATKALADLGLENVELHWISAFAENMIDGGAYKADDILASYSGQTVEIFNTDAEGRLTLMDALAYSTLLDPDYIVDTATLTGACIMAVSKNFTALMSNSKDLKDKLISHFEAENEPTVYTPMPERLRKEVKGEISDLMNTSHAERQAGHITAGLFLSHFVDQNLFRNPKLTITNPKIYKWAHLDIAGSASNNKQNSLGTNGATGQSVRSLVSWVMSEDE